MFTPDSTSEVKCPACGTPIAPPSARVTLPLGPTPEAPASAPSGHITISLGESTDCGPLSPPSGEFPFLAPPQQPDELGRLGSYRVLGVLGRGGMGAVFRTEDPVLMRQIALKVMLPEVAANPVDAARFLREARAQAAVEHDHVAAIYQVGEQDGIPFIAMPMLKGESLAATLRETPRLPIPEAVRIAREMAEGLAAAHEKGLIHRDIKPGNVWLEGKQRRVKILDFGLARVTTDNPTLANNSGPTTQSGYVVGTPAYMSPEQARGAPLDSRSDLFSLGTVLYRILSGDDPFRGNTPTELLIAVATEHPSPLSASNPHIPPELDALTMRLLAKNPAHRPASAEETAGFLREIEAGLAATPRSTPNSLQRVTTTSPNSPITVPVRSTDTTTLASQPVHRKGPPRLLVGLLLCFLVAVAVAAQVVIKIRNKDGTETEIKAPEGSTVTVTKGGKEIAKVGPDDKKEPAKPLDDRAAAEHAIKLGGKVRVNNEMFPIGAVADLPKAPFRLTGLNLSDLKGLTEADLAPFADCKNLTILECNQSNMTDAGFAHFKRCEQLTNIYLDVTQVTDAGMVQLNGYKKLEFLALNLTAIGDKGLAHLKDCTSLRELWLNDSQVTDTGLKYLKNCKKLRTLNVCNKQITPAGAAWVKINLPDCAFQWQKPEETPRFTDDHIAALHSLSLGGKVFLNTPPIDKRSWISQAKDLPSGDFKLTAIDMWKNEGSPITDNDLAVFKDCKGLIMLGLSNARKVTDEGLKHFKDHEQLVRLHLPDTGVTDSGLQLFKDRSGIYDIVLSNTRVTDEGLAYFKGCRNLRYLSVDNTRVTDEGLAYFKGCEYLTTLSVNNTDVTDKGIAPFRAHRMLQELHVRKTRVTTEMVKDFAEALPMCKIQSDHGNFEPRKK